jgi:hypothetical protein
LTYPQKAGIGNAKGSNHERKQAKWQENEATGAA